MENILAKTKELLDESEIVDVEYALNNKDITNIFLYNALFGLNKSVRIRTQLQPSLSNKTEEFKFKYKHSYILSEIYSVQGFESLSIHFKLRNGDNVVIEETIELGKQDSGWVKLPNLSAGYKGGNVFIEINIKYKVNKLFGEDLEITLMKVINPNNALFSKIRDVYLE